LILTLFLRHTSDVVGNSDIQFKVLTGEWAEGNPKNIIGAARIKVSEVVDLELGGGSKP
jgi:hypothetical protein